MARQEIGGVADDNNLNKVNHNFIELYDGVQDASGKINKVEKDINARMDNFIDETSDKALGKVVDNAKLNWKEPVDSFEHLPISANKGDTRMDKSTGKVFRYDGTGWKEIQQIDAGPVNELDIRLSSQLAQTEKYENQYDFINLINNNTDEYDEVLFKKENSVNYFNIIYVKNNKHITYQFRPSQAEDYIVLGDIFSGNFSKSASFVESVSPKDEDYNGEWNKSSSPNYYTTEIGASFEVELEGETIFFNHRSDNNGGMWEFIIDDDTENVVTVSTYSQEPVPLNKTKIAEFNRLGTHTIKGIFRGADINNPPSSGTPRGWIMASENTNSSRTILSERSVANNTREITIAPTSNKEFAFQIRKNGVGNFEFVPYHGVATAFEVEPAKILVDDNHVNVSDFPVGYTIGNIEKFELIQHINGFNPAIENPLIEVRTITKLNEKGFIKIFGKMKALTDVEISNGYGIMIPVSTSFSDRLVTSLRNEYPTTKTDGSRTELIDESDRSFGGCFISDDKEMVLGYRYDDIKRTLRQNGDNKMRSNNLAWIEHRDANIQKLYNSVYYNAELIEGDSYTWEGTIVAANLSQHIINVL